ncbi:DNA repair photolyase [Thermodesulfovibrio aggregans]|uniref:DNA repair photolyase n=1 Tax=Thermodesulfovibrio aggregans TaxID=86166 RepID=A0A0U9HPS0_9BACT|nr:radical SAM protein [Thermodesulfovibrio aggregans]GAQ94457.1 DNA repair photolyase [Thermodesulfovibrio aggregans]
MYLRPFDPWKSELCTCPPKYSLNPYTGCAHRCLYCYASSYIKDFFHLREKRALIKTLKREIKKIPEGSLISLSNTSDPYPPIEKDKEITRKCLEIFKEHNMRVLIITKSNIVLRDIDLLKEIPSSVTFTVTTFKYESSLEPNAPSSFERLKAAERVSKEGIPVGIRLDPIIPYINEDEIEKILKEAKNCGVRHITASTFKPRWDSWIKISKAFPEEAKKIKELYFRDGKKYSNSWYLPESLRKQLMLKVRKICDSLSLTFSSCREGFPELTNALSCDGSHLAQKKSFSQEQVATLF